MSRTEGKCIAPSEIDWTSEGLSKLSESHTWRLEKVEDYADGLLERDSCLMCGMQRVCIIVQK
ncbi:MAG: hypothetical protein ACREBS_03395 [Nitrososphaerales archaeon]